VDFEAEEMTQEGERIWDAVVTKADGSTVTLVEDGTCSSPRTRSSPWPASASSSMEVATATFARSPYTTLGFTYQQALYNRFVALGTVTADGLPGRLGEHQRLHPVRTGRLVHRDWS
jgi:hypothetical protein